MLVYIDFGTSLYRFTVYQGCIWSPLQNLDAGILLHLYFSICSAFEWFLDLSETIPMVRFDAQLLSHSPIIPFPHHRFPSVLTQINYLCIPFCRFLNPNSCCNNLGCKKSHEHLHMVSENETTQNAHFNSGENDGKPWNFGVSQFLNHTMFSQSLRIPEKSFVQTTITIQSTTPSPKSNHPHQKNPLLT